MLSDFYWYVGFFWMVHSISEQIHKHNNFGSPEYFLCAFLNFLFWPIGMIFAAYRSWKETK